MTKDAHDQVKAGKDGKSQESKLAPGDVKQDLRDEKTQAQKARDARLIGASASSKVVIEQIGKLEIDFSAIAGKDGKVTAAEIEQYEKKHQKDISPDEKAALDYLKTHIEDKPISAADGTRDTVGGKAAFRMSDLKALDRKFKESDAEAKTAKDVSEAAKTHDLSKVIKDINEAAKTLSGTDFEKYVKAVTEQLHGAGILPKDLQVRADIYTNTGIPSRLETLAVQKTDGSAATTFDAKGKDTLGSAEISDLFASKKTQDAESKADMAHNVAEQGKAHFEDIDTRTGKDRDGQLSLEELKAYRDAHKADKDPTFGGWHPEYSLPDKAVDDMIAHYDEIKGQKWDGRKGITKKDLEAYAKQTEKKHEKAEKHDEREEKKAKKAEEPSADAKAESKPESNDEAKPAADSAAAKPSEDKKSAEEKHIADVAHQIVKDAGGTDGHVTLEELKAYQQKKLDKQEDTADVTEKSRVVTEMIAHYRDMQKASRDDSKLGLRGEKGITDADVDAYSKSLNDAFQKDFAERPRLSPEDQTKGDQALAVDVKDAAKSHDLTKVIEDVTKARDTMNPKDYQHYLNTVTTEMRAAGILSKSQEAVGAGDGKLSVWENVVVAGGTHRGSGITDYDAKGDDKTADAHEYPNLFGTQKAADAQKKAEPADDILDKRTAGIRDPFAPKHSESEVWVEVGPQDNPDKILDKFATAAFERANGRKPSEAELTQQLPEIIKEIIKDNPDAFKGGEVPKKFPKDTDIRVKIPTPRPKANPSLD